MAPAEAPKDEVLQGTAVVQHHGITIDPHLGAVRDDWDAKSIENHRKMVVFHGIW